MGVETKLRSPMVQIILIAALATSGPLPAFATETHRFNVPVEGAVDAIRDFAAQAHVQILVDGENVKDKHLHPVLGEYSTDKGLSVLLADSGLKPRYVGDHSIALVTLAQAADAATQGTDGAKEGKKSDSFRVAPVDQGTTSSTPFVDSSASSSTSERGTKSEVIEQIVVTAQKRKEREQDVPVSMTVLDPQTLAENGQGRLVDYFATVPGLSVTSNSSGNPYVTIRGLSVGRVQNPTVSTVIDDVPIGSSTELALGQLSSPDIDPSDLDHIEVLKGPQGTLYGADSLGGLIKYVTKDPSTAAFSGRAEVNGVDIPDGGLGFAVRGAANVPLLDTLAIKVSGFARRDPGYIDDLTTGRENENSADVYGGHFAALWAPSEDFSAKLSALLQHTDGHGVNQVDSNILGQIPSGNLTQTGLPGTAPWTSDTQLYAATLKAKLADLDWTSVTGYSVNKFDNTTDFSAFYGPSAVTYFRVPASAGENNFQTDKLSQELRVSSSVGHWIDWLLGGFYTHETNPNTFQNYYAATLAGSNAGSLFYISLSPITLSEYAFFGDLTAHLTDRFDVQVGGRESWNRQSYGSVYSGPLPKAIYGMSPYVNTTEHANGNAFTYLVTPSFKVSPDLMIYARVASGYRIGGPNATIYPNIPSSYKPDTTTNYELGIKGDLWQHRLTFDAAAYYIAWNDFQIGLHNSGCACYFEGNAGKAKSKGLEASIQARPITGLTITAQGSFTNAVLTQDLPKDVVDAGTYGVAGDRLPYSIRWSGGLTINQEFLLSSAWTGFVGGSVTYVGSRDTEFAPGAGASRIVLPSYTTANLTTGARYDAWRINLYINNVGNRRGIADIQQAYGSTFGTNQGYYTSIVQPRTVGLSASRTF